MPYDRGLPGKPPAGKLGVCDRLRTGISAATFRNGLASLGQARWPQKVFLATLLALGSTPLGPPTHASTPNPSRAFEHTDPLSGGPFYVKRSLRPRT